MAFPDCRRLLPLARHTLAADQQNESAAICGSIEAYFRRHTRLQKPPISLARNSPSKPTEHGISHIAAAGKPIPASVFSGC
jgi:hypothetical protein